MAEARDLKSLQYGFESHLTHMEIYPLITPNLYWPIFQSSCKKVLGDSPTRGLDESYINIKDPAAVLACLNMDNKPLETLREYSLAWEHYYLGFLVIGPLPIEVITHTELFITIKESNHKVINIISGRLSQWFRAIKYLFTLNEDAKEFAGHVKEIMCSTGLKEIFYGNIK